MLTASVNSIKFIPLSMVSVSHKRFSKNVGIGTPNCSIFSNITCYLDFFIFEVLVLPIISVLYFCNLVLFSLFPVPSRLKFLLFIVSYRFYLAIICLPSLVSSTFNALPISLRKNYRLILPDLPPFRNVISAITSRFSNLYPLSTMKVSSSS